jgi:hypothetical protein
LKLSLYKAFILGFYDGDGWKTTSAIGNTNYKFLMQIKRDLNIKNKVKPKKGKVEPNIVKVQHFRFYSLIFEIFYLSEEKISSFCPYYFYNFLIFH